MCLNAALFTMLAMLFEVYICHSEGTLSRSYGKVGMSFWRNWSVSIGGFLIFPAVNALVVSNLPAFTNPRWILAIIGGFLITAGLYAFWWNEGEGNKGHILYWKKNRGNHWVKDITGAGWVHFLYMIVQISILFAYILNPMSQPVVIAVGSLFAAYVIVVILQAHYVQKNLKWSAVIGEMLAVVAITAIKWW
ncbi:MAG: hypothetical protein NT170_04945 [Candidatus Moranbacteria bacterium]|nr:hypothetical protein [Candidatus Moranbacteria bacterium]